MLQKYWMLGIIIKLSMMTECFCLFFLCLYATNNFLKYPTRVTEAGIISDLCLTKSPINISGFQDVLIVLMFNYPKIQKKFQYCVL